MALVIKEQRTCERDLAVTLVTREQGKILVAAKGVRQIKSSKRAYLETGNLVHVQLVTTRGWPILTQAQLVASAAAIREDFTSVKKFLLFLEILDRLLVSEELSPALFQKIIYLRELFVQRAGNRLIQPHFEEVLALLGYANPQAQTSISQQVNQILDSPLHTYDYLSIT